MTLLTILSPFVTLVLALTTAVYLREFIGGPRRHAALARPLLAASLFLAVLRFGVFLQVMGRPPLASPGEAFTTVALAILVVYTLLEFLLGERSTGFFVLAFATAFQAVGLFAPPAGNEVNVVLREAWFGTHVLTAILGYTAFAVGAVYSTLFLLLYSDLKHRRFGFIYERVPPLDVLSRMAIRTAFLGFVFLTTAIAVGAIGWVRELDHPAFLDPKVMSSLLVWVVYGLALAMHQFTGWRGIRSIGITLAAFLLMVLSSWLVPVLLGSVHDVRETQSVKELL